MSEEAKLCDKGKSCKWFPSSCGDCSGELFDLATPFTDKFKRNVEKEVSRRISLATIDRQAQLQAEREAGERLRGALEEARDVLALLTLIDKSNQSNRALGIVEQALGKKGKKK